MAKRAISSSAELEIKSTLEQLTCEKREGKGAGHVCADGGWTDGGCRINLKVRWSRG